MTAVIHDRARLVRLNSDLSNVLDRDPAQLVGDRAEAATDALVVCGVVGGKDVGKSSLINALCGAHVSRNDEQVGEGTFGAVVYVHESDEPELRSRLGRVFDGDDAFARSVQDVVTHSADAARGLVLVDLPDMSSTFERHAEVVRSVAPSLDRVVWVWDPVLAGDRSYSERVGRVVKDPSNVYFVLNKADLLLRDPVDGDAASVWSDWVSWFRGSVRSSVAGVEQANGTIGDDRWYVLSAAFPEPGEFVAAVRRSWGDGAPESMQGLASSCAERAASDLVRLRTTLLRALTADEVVKIKSGNVSAIVASDRTELVRHFDLGRVVGLIDDAHVVAREELDRSVGEEFVQGIGERLARRGASDGELADRVLATRLDHWPLLPAIFWLGRGLIRWFGRRLAGALMSSSGVSRGQAWSVDGVPLTLRMDGMMSRLRVRLTDLSGVLREEPAWPEASLLAEQFEVALEEVTDQLDDAVVASCVGSRKPPGLIKRSFVWFIALWFILLQPVLEGVLGLLAKVQWTWSEGIVAGLRRAAGTGIEAASILVSALGAEALLRGLFVVILIYAIWLALMYARAVRDVRRARGLVEADATPIEVYGGRVQGVIDRWVRGPVLAPIELLAQRAGGWRDLLGGKVPDS